MTLCINVIQHATEYRYTECRYADCRVFLNVMLYVVMLNVIMLNVVMLNGVMLNIVMLNVVMLSVVMLNVVMLNVVMLSVVMLSVAAPFSHSYRFHKRLHKPSLTNGLSYSGDQCYESFFCFLQKFTLLHNQLECLIFASIFTLV